MRPAAIRVGAAASVWKCLIPVIRDLHGLHSEAQRDVFLAVENLKQVIADPAAKFAFASRFGDQFDPPIACAAFGTGHVRLDHRERP